MSNRNVDKGREAENAVAAVFAANGMPHAERRTKRGGRTLVDCHACRGHVHVPGDCETCHNAGVLDVPADAGDLTGIPGVVVQVKWSGYKPLAEDMRRTDEQRRVAGADVGLLVRKRKGVGVARAGEWDAYLPQWQVAHLLACAWPQVHDMDTPAAADTWTAWQATWRTDLATAVRLLAAAGYGTPVAA